MIRPFWDRREFLPTWVLAVFTMVAVCLVGDRPSHSADLTKLAGPFQQDKFAAVVQSIRQRKLKPDEVHRFRLDAELSAGSLKQLEGRLRRGTGRGVVWAEVSRVGALRVAIETRDLGHGGEVGYMYSETQLTVSDTVELGREWTIARQVSKNWWMIVYRLG